MRKLRKFTASFGENALEQRKQNLKHVKNTKTSYLQKTPPSYLKKNICYNFKDVKYAPSEIHSAMDKLIN